jgi:hypothetical protein
MCITEFNYLLEPVGSVTWEPSMAPCGGCDRIPTAGEQVEQWVEIPESRDEWDQDTDRPPVQVLHCQHCTQAARLLGRWCGAQFAVDDIASQIDEHWHEDDSCRSGPFCHLVTLAKSRWMRAERLVPADEIRVLVDRSADEVTNRLLAGGRRG